jgi:uncharacterized protein (TIGR02246 family)
MDDEDQIRDVLTRWAQMYADQAWDAWSELFTRDGAYTTAEDQTFDGREAIRHHRDGQAMQVTFVCAPAVIRIDGQAARAASDYVAYARSGTESAWSIQAVGRLVHDLVRESGEWFIARGRAWAYFSGPHTPSPLPSVTSTHP